MAPKKTAPEPPDGTLVAMGKSIGATVGTVAGALGITTDKPTVQKVAKSVKKTVAHVPKPRKKATKKAAKPSKPAAKKS